MKSGRFLCPSRNHVAAMGIALGVALLLSSSARAQNLVNNPGFNSPISTNAVTTTNWVVTYVYGSRDDFAIADRTTWAKRTFGSADANRSEEHTSELQSRLHLVCRLLLEKK